MTWGGFNWKLNFRWWGKHWVTHCCKPCHIQTFKRKAFECHNSLLSDSFTTLNLTMAKPSNVKVSSATTRDGPKRRRQKWASSHAGNGWRALCNRQGLLLWGDLARKYIQVVYLTSYQIRLGPTTRGWTSGEGRTWKWASESGNVAAPSRSSHALMLVTSSGRVVVNCIACNECLNFQRQVTLHLPWRSCKNCQQECCKSGGGNHSICLFRLFLRSLCRCGWTSGGTSITAWIQEHAMLILGISLQGKPWGRTSSVNRSGEGQKSSFSWSEYLFDPCKLVPPACVSWIPDFENEN